MRMGIYLITSLAVAAGMCVALLVTGILRFDQQASISCQPVRHNKASAVNNALSDKKPAEIRPEQMTPDLARTEHSSVPQTKAELDPKRTKPTGDQKKNQPARRSEDRPTKAPFLPPLPDEVYQRAVSYLYFLTQDSTGQAESRFARFLKTEFDLDSNQIDRLLQQAFWKNFLVFQQQWPANRFQELKQAFEQELGLKKAGFAVRGIPLMPDAIKTARNRLASLRQRPLQKADSSRTTSEDPS